ncbi:hypothetical protein VTN00DRAFT_5608 [Thermoascus crustaceus]|uniref:uncharacterized protein n=1 Tax=Thermoascus crustaceus TaxID=5088 RepID=UPI0037449E06
MVARTAKCHTEDCKFTTSNRPGNPDRQWRERREDTLPREPSGIPIIHHHMNTELPTASLPVMYAMLPS